jgi:thiol-disulfide isomerase/thioredoxin
MTHKVKSVPVLMLLLSLLASGAGAAGDEASLVLKDLNGREQSLDSYRGKTVVLNFWATWCAPCVKEMPILVSVQNRYGAWGLQVIGASADEQPDKIPAFIKKLKINFPVWVGATTADMERLGVGNALPATAIIDHNGQVVERIPGVVKKEDLEKRIEAILHGRSDRDAPAKPEPGETHRESPGEKDQHDHQHEHKDGENHKHGGIGLEGASTVPS